ncbi:MAG TPA: S8 family serine peptidase [Thermoanaerobaculia bacterium]|nr:S8 family serine peptidase [Thermoanaerobaculia bacterium]
MRRLPLLFVLLLTTTLFADDVERTRRRLAPEERLGRAMILHPVKALTEADRAELAEKGIAVKHPLAGGRYLARVQDGATTEDARIVSIEPLTARQKIHSSALRETGRGKTWVKVNVIFQRDVDFADARAAILSAGGALPDPFTVKFSPSHRLEATIAPTALDALASDERVLTVTGVRKWQVRTDNAASAATSHVTEVQAAPYNLTGAGVNVSLFELAAGQQDHVEFTGRMTVSALGGSVSDKAHATHTAGTIGAAGINPSAKGMAPGVRLFQQCVEAPANDCENDWLEDKDEVLPTLGISIDSNSWGYVLGWTAEGGYPVWLDSEEYFGAYDLIVGAPLDEISNEHGILFVHSAGNDGNGTAFDGSFSEHRHVDDEGETITNQLFCYSKNASGTDCPVTCTGGCETVRHDPDLPFDTIGVTAGAKNIITVGSIVNNGTFSDISGFSSRGPAKDGRVKPDVVARGSSVLSSIPTNAYGRLSGTSMATPVVSGVAALLVEQWRKTFNGASPTPAQLKALIIAGTDDMGNPGPDYTFGFGLVNAQRAVDTIIGDAGAGNRIRNLTFAEGLNQIKEATVQLTQTQNLRVVLNWADPPIPYLGGDDIAQKALVNDLDLKVIGPDGTTHLPWVLSKANFRDNATRGVNEIDNIEMLEIANAAPGLYRIVATGSSVTEGPQDAVLVASASLANAAPPCVDPQEVGRSNDTPETASRGIVTGSLVRGAICTAADVDYFTFTVSKSGPVVLGASAFGDTNMRFVITGPGINLTTDVIAHSATTINVPAIAAFPATITVRIAPIGAYGQEPTYTFTPVFGQTGGGRRRSVGR